MDKRWTDAQKWEGNWHGLCLNTYGEEKKQLLYAEKMGLSFQHNGRTPYNIDVKGAEIADIGCGPVSLLLKTLNLGYAEAVDPLTFPSWVVDRYQSAGIKFVNLPGERWTGDRKFDEVWIYNCLEHTYDPKKIIENALERGKIVRIFEWLDTPSTIGHPQTLREAELNEWLGGEGRVEMVNRGRVNGKAYWGVFPGKSYE